MGREPRQRQQAAAAARNASAPVSQSTSILDMPNDQFQGALRELASQGLPQDRIDDLMRQYRSANSPLAPINEAAATARQEADAGGRKSIVGGMFTKDAGATGMDAVRSMRPSLTAGLLGALQGGGQAVGAPMAAAQGLIPQGDMALEALGTAGAAMTGGGAATTPRGSLRAGLARNAKVNKSVRGMLGDQMDLTMDMTDDAGRNLGRVDYSVYDGQPAIQMIEVNPEFQRQGVGTELLRNLQREYPDQEIDWGSLTPDGAQLYDNTRFIDVDQTGGINQILPDIEARAKAAEADYLATFRDDFAGNPTPIREAFYRLDDELETAREMASRPPRRMIDLSANADTSGGLLATAASDALTPSQQMARRILDMRAAGRARDVTDDMMAQADPQYMFNNTPLPMDAASRAARAQAAGFGDDMYHGSTHSFDNFGGGRTRNTEGHFGAGDYLTSSADDASMNYAGEGPDLTQRITMRAEQLADEMGVDYDDPAALAAARNELSGGTDGLVYPVRYRANKEFDISDDGDTFLSYDQPQMDPADYLDEAGGDMDLAQELAMDDSYNFEPEGDLVNFMDSIRWDGRVSDNEGLLSALQENAYDGGLLGRQVDDVMRNTEWWAEDDMGGFVNNEVYRNSLQDAGFDAIRHNGDIFAGMDIEPGTTHTIINNPANIRSRFARFDPEFAHLSNLSAANVSPTAGSLATISADDEEQRKRDIVQRLMPSAQNIIRRQ